MQRQVAAAQPVIAEIPAGSSWSPLQLPPAVGVRRPATAVALLQNIQAATDLLQPSIEVSNAALQAGPGVSKDTAGHSGLESVPTLPEHEGGHSQLVSHRSAGQSGSCVSSESEQDLQGHVQTGDEHAEERQALGIVDVADEGSGTSLEW